MYSLWREEFSFTLVEISGWLAVEKMPLLDIWEDLAFLARSISYGRKGGVCKLLFCCLGSSMFASTLGGEKKNELMKFSHTLDATHLAPTVVLLLQRYLLTCNTKALSWHCDSTRQTQLSVGT